VRVHHRHPSPEAILDARRQRRRAAILFVASILWAFGVGFLLAYPTFGLGDLPLVLVATLVLPAVAFGIRAGRRRRRAVHVPESGPSPEAERRLGRAEGAKLPTTLVLVTW